MSEFLVYSFTPRTGNDSLYHDFNRDSDAGLGRWPLEEIRRSKGACAVGSNRVIYSVTVADGIFSLPRFILTDGLVH